MSPQEKINGYYLSMVKDRREKSFPTKRGYIMKLLMVDLQNFNMEVKIYTTYCLFSREWNNKFS